MSAEHIRLQEARERRTHWKRWGPYLAERAWGTVREDYSAGGEAWTYFPFDHSRSRAYRWNEDGLAGICDRHQYICFAIALWNGRDPFLKERLFGLSGKEGNHGEDVKECYFYLDSTPTHSYMKYLYKYPHAEFPYRGLVEENSRRSREEPEYKLLDTGVFSEDRYFDVTVEYAKAAADDILVRISVTNRGPEPAELQVLPTAWFRNTWSWGRDERRPVLRQPGSNSILLEHHYYGRRTLFCEGAPELLFTENETNHERLDNVPNVSRFAKDGINDYVVHGDSTAVNPLAVGTKAAARYRLSIGPAESVTLRLRLTGIGPAGDPGVGASFDVVFGAREDEAAQFYRSLLPSGLSADARNVARQAFAGLLWSKQFYHFVVKDWLEGDPAQPPPPSERKTIRNSEWPHLFNADVISMPDKWEYPWYASWDLAFHSIPLAIVDPDFAKEQLVLMLREWYMHPNGQLPAYEWALGDVNPPVHAWAAWRVYKLEQKHYGRADTAFLERVFHKLLLNFTWWVNRKDAGGRNIFQGGFLGLDNIGIFNRSQPLPTGGRLEQADGTGWMGMYCLNMLAIAMELALSNRAYADVASKFWEHFLNIAYAINHLGENSTGMWDEEDGFYYDVLNFPGGGQTPLKLRSIVGLIPLFAVQTLEPEFLDKLPGFKRRMEWFIENRPDLTGGVASMKKPGEQQRRLLSIVTPDQLRRVLSVVLDEEEFLSPHGIRSLSRYHRRHPYTFDVNGERHSVEYEPAESKSPLFGGNSNWRGPVWFPINFLFIESLQKFHHYFGDEFQVECPTGSGRLMNLSEVASELSRRLQSLLLRDAEGRRPANGVEERFRSDPHWRDLLWFHEYFDGDRGTGLGASHQTGWTGLIAKLLLQSGGY